MTHETMPHKGFIAAAGTPGGKGPWVSIQAVAEYTGLSVDTLYGYVANKTMPFSKLGTTRNAPLRFSIPAIDEWVEGGGADGYRRRAEQDAPEAAPNGNEAPGTD